MCQGQDIQTASPLGPPLGGLLEPGCRAGPTLGAQQTEWHNGTNAWLFCFEACALAVTESPRESVMASLAFQGSGWDGEQGVLSAG